MKFGHFDDEHREYVIETPKTPLPWINYLGSKEFFSLISNTCGGYTFYKDAKLLRLTRYRYNDVPMDINGKYFYIKDRQRPELRAEPEAMELQEVPCLAQAEPSPLPAWEHQLPAQHPVPGQVPHPVRVPGQELHPVREQQLQVLQVSALLSFRRQQKPCSQSKYWQPREILA